MTKRWTWMILILMALLALWGCSDDDDPVAPTPATPWEVLAEAGKAYINGDECPGVTAASNDFSNTDDYIVIDVRSEAHYDEGHIPGAYLSTLSTVLSDIGTTIPYDAGKTIVVVCYTGQSAGHVKIALELMGYGDVKSMGFGMCSWSADVSLPTKWADKCLNVLDTIETTNNNDGLDVHDFPTLTGYDVDTVIETRVQETLEDGFQSILYENIENDLTDPFFLNYWGVADYEGDVANGADAPGHIPGAFQFTPKASLGFDEMLKNLPTDRPIVVYCWTGQHSSQITFYLNMLGYTAYSLAYGSNNLFYDDLTAHKWTAEAQKDFGLEVTPVP